MRKSARSQPDRRPTDVRPIRRRLRAASLALAALAASLAAATSRARADAPPPAGDADPLSAWPTELSLRPLTIPHGTFELRLPLNANLSVGQVWEPIYTNPSLYYGVTDRFMVGLRHFTGLCLTGADGGCPRVYEDVSVDAVGSLWRAGALDLAVGAALDASFVDEFALAGEVRAVAKYRARRLGVTLAPQLTFGLTGRDQTIPPSVGFASNGGFENGQVLTLPLWLDLQATDALALTLGAELTGPIGQSGVSFSDVYRVPFIASLTYAATRRIDVGTTFWFDDLWGPEGTTDRRRINVFATFRL